MRLKNLKWSAGEVPDVWHAYLRGWQFNVERTRDGGKWHAKIEGTYKDYAEFDDVPSARAWCVQRWWHIRSRTMPNLVRRRTHPPRAWMRGRQGTDHVEKP